VGVTGGLIKISYSKRFASQNDLGILLLVLRQIMLHLQTGVRGLKWVSWLMSGVYVFVWWKGQWCEVKMVHSGQCGKDGVKEGRKQTQPSKKVGGSGLKRGSCKPSSF
jgi:hypothetical protein